MKKKNYFKNKTIISLSIRKSKYHKKTKLKKKAQILHLKGDKNRSPKVFTRVAKECLSFTRVAKKFMICKFRKKIINIFYKMH
jgi:hypothetical protein